MSGPRLHLLVCTVCWQRPWTCSCAERKQTEDKQHVTSAGWERLPVFTLAQVGELLAEGTDLTPREQADLLTRLTADPPPRRSSRAGEGELRTANAEVIA